MPIRVTSGAVTAPLSSLLAGCSHVQPVSCWDSSNGQSEESSAAPVMLTRARATSDRSDMG